MSELIKQTLSETDLGNSPDSQTDPSELTELEGTMRTLLPKRTDAELWDKVFELADFIDFQIGGIISETDWVDVLIEVLLHKKEEREKEKELREELLSLGLDEQEICDNQIDDKVPFFVEHSGTEIFDCWVDRKSYETAKEFFDEGKSVWDVAKELGIPRSTVSRMRRQWKVEWRSRRTSRNCGRLLNPGVPLSRSHRMHGGGTAPLDWLGSVSQCPIALAAR
jgi:hypothetical protein